MIPTDERFLTLQKLTHFSNKCIQNNYRVDKAFLRPIQQIKQSGLRCSGYLYLKDQENDST